jgi:hypothetical protein
VIDSFIQFLILAQAETSAFRAVEYDWPETPLQWLIYVGGFALLVVVGLRVQLKDTAELKPFWRGWLFVLRVAALAGIVVIALNPQERTQKMAFRPSQVAVLVDRSLSMQFPESTPVGVSSDPGSPAAKGRTRAEAVSSLFAESEFIGELRTNHNVSVYSFDSALNGPHHVLRSLDPRAQTAGSPLNEPQENEGSGSADNPNATADDANADTSTADWAGVVEPTGLETRLGESLLDLIRQISDPSLSGIVIVGDGAWNAGVDPQSAIELARSTKTKLITVGVGSTDQPVNVQIASLQAPSDVQAGDAFEIAAFVQAQGLSGRPARVELLGKPEEVEGQASPLGSTEVILGEDGVPLKVPFEQLQNQAGAWEYFIRVTPSDRVLELSSDDNERRKSINVVDRKTRVMILAGGPMRDYRFVRNMLYRHSAIQTDVWLQSADLSGAVSQESNKLLSEFPQTKEELFEYDVVIAFDPDWSKLDEEQISLMREWVFAQAGGLLVVAGDVYTPDVASEPSLAGLRELYPVVLSSYVPDFGNERAASQAWPFEFTREGREAGFLHVTDDPVTSADVWNDFAGIYSSYPTSGAKAGATVFAQFSDPRAQTGFGLPVLLASQYYGAGRVLFLGSPEMWRLRAIDEVYYDRFWTKAIREVGQARLKRGNNRGTLLLERTQYVRGQTVRVRAQLLDPQFEPLIAPSITAEVYDPEGRPMLPALTMQRDENLSGQFVGSFRVGMSGVWRIELPIPQSQDMLSEKIDVVLPSLETDNARQNAQLLRLIASETGGEYFALNEAAVEVPKRLPNRGEEFQIDQQLRTLWDRQWLMFLLVGLLSTEWLTRKLLKLA